MVNIQKAAIIGCGFVGASSAFSLLQKGIFSELVLIDANKEKAEGEAMDISHGRPYAHPMKIYAGSYDDISDCSLIIITAGANQKPGETRLDLVHKNVAIFKSIIPEITKRGFEGILLVVANPVDILTYAALKISGYPKERVFGSGTVLDTARFRYLLSEHLQVASRSVHANIIGEHGDSELAVWSGANVAGIPINDFCELRGHYQHQESMERIYIYDAVKWAVGSKVTSGLTETTFGPQETCTRAQTVTFLWRAAGSPQTNSVDNPFTDVKRSDYYYQAVLWAVANNVTNGVSATSFDPNVTVQRDQVVTFL